MRSCRFAVMVLIAVLFVFAVQSTSFSAGTGNDDEILSVMENMKEELNKKENELERTQRQLDRANRNLNKANNNNKEKKRLEREVSSLNKKLQAKEKEISGLKAEIERLKAQVEAQGDRYNPPVPSGEWHPQAKYRVKRWNLSNRTVEIEAKDGSKIPPARGVKMGVNGIKISLRVPIEFTVPDDVEVIHMDIKDGYNYKILDDGSLGKLDTFEGQDEHGTTHKGRAAYPGDRVLMVKSGAMTVWLLDY